MKNDLVSERFKILRENSNLTQSQIAEFLNIDQSYILKFEKGERNLNIDMLEKICSLFGCTLSYFEDESESYTPLNITFGSNNLNIEDLETIAAINKIALNIRLMNSLLGEGIVEK